MNYSKIAVRYAKALFDLAGEQKFIDAVYEDMKVIDRLCTMQEVKEIISSPVIGYKVKRDHCCSYRRGHKQTDRKIY
jgi:F-type H+-transporting ATPase subunit delta